MSCVAVIVNYRTAALTVGAAESLATQAGCDAIHVVDNSLQTEQADYLQRHLAPAVKLQVATSNLGFAGACNRAFAETDSEYVLLLNPDARLLPDALARLLELLHREPRCGAVGPRVFWDDELLFQLPPTTFPGRPEFVIDRLAGNFAALGRWRAARFRRQSLRQWRANAPFRVAALSGGHVLLRRSAVEAAGGLFDPAFFMYWEDSDLMRRLRDAGYALYLEPRAGCIHHYDHHPGKDKLIADGWPPYAAKHFAGRPWRWFERLSARLGQAGAATAQWPVIDLDAADIRIPLPPALHAGWLLEFSPSPNFVPSMGRFGQGPEAGIPPACAQHFHSRDFYVRIGAPVDCPPLSLRFVARHRA